MLQHCVVVVTAIFAGLVGLRPAEQWTVIKPSVPHQMMILAAGPETIDPATKLNPESTLPSKELVTAIIQWISTNFDVPPPSTLPRIQMASAERIAALHYSESQPDGPHPSRIVDLGVPNDPREVVSVYDRATKTIHLPEGWTGHTASEVSILVHEIVHHLQNEAHLSYECTAASEKLAYEAQEKWLNLFGLNLGSEFQIDPFTLLVSSLCGY